MTSNPQSPSSSLKEKFRMTPDKWKRVFREIIYTGFLIIVVLAIRSSIASNYRVPTGSMIPTILPGDQFFASQFHYGWRIPFMGTHITPPEEPQRGDISVFPSPVEPEINLVKRLVATGGDRIAIRSGQVYINGQAIEQEFIETTPEGFDVYMEKLFDRPHRIQFDRNFPHMRNMEEIQIPPNHFFAMGDNRDHSADSRMFGFVPSDQLRARAWRIFFSLNFDEFPYLRGNRFGKALP